MDYTTMNTGFYSFLSIAGRQGQFPYFLVQCPLRLVPRLFLFDETEIPASLRKLRSLDAGTVEEVAQYLIAQPDDYILAPLIATINCQVTFTSSMKDHPEIGQLTIPLTAQLIIQYGQHQRAAIQQFLIKAPEHGSDTVPVMLFPDPDLVRSPKLYTDLHQVSVQGSRSQRILHERSDLATFVRQLIDETPIFQDRVELEKTTISNRSTALFTLSAVYQATEALLHAKKGAFISSYQALIGQKFWLQLGEIIPEWGQVICREVTPSHLRVNYVHAHTVTLLAIGMAGHTLIQAHPDDWNERLQMLKGLDWSRGNAQLWEGRAMVRGRMSKSRDSINLTTIAIKRTIGLTISEQESEIESRLLGL